MQRNWIGRSEGTLVDFKLDGATDPTGSDNHRFHHARRYDLRRDLAPARARASVGRSTRGQQSTTCCAPVDKLIAEQRNAREVGDIGEIEKHGVNTGTLRHQSFQRTRRFPSG